MKVLLLPLSWVYHLAIAIRHGLFNLGLLKSKSFNLPVICVGNLSVGGTGKTPHIEYLIRLLRSNYRVATLSRGYGRSSTGFLIASAETKADVLGDEPRQFATKFDDIIVSVDEKRVNGISKLLELQNAPEVILLDDAFQHRWVKPGLNIVLTDYHHLYSEDFLLPAGKLRDSKRSVKRAHMIVVTKTPAVFSPYIAEELSQKLRPLPHQSLFFSYINYGNLTPVQSNTEVFVPRTISSILLVSGIANVYPLKERLLTKCTELTELSYPDHHRYTENDFRTIVNTFHNIIGRNKLIVTTEKDAMRFRDSEYFRILEKLPLFYVPIEVAFHNYKGENFDEKILNYVGKNHRNS